MASLNINVGASTGGLQKAIQAVSSLLKNFGGQIAGTNTELKNAIAKASADMDKAMADVTKSFDTFGSAGAKSTDKVSGSTKTLRAQLREATIAAQQLSEKYGINSTQAIAAQKTAGKLKDEIGDMAARINAFNPDERFKAFTSVLQGASGAFGAVTGGMQLFGIESENAQKAMVKLQAIMAITQGLDAIKGMGDSLKTVQASISGATTAFKAMDMVMKASVIGIVIAAVVVTAAALSGAFDTTNAAIQKNADVTKAAAEVGRNSLKAWDAEERILRAIGVAEDIIIGKRTKKIEQQQVLDIAAAKAAKRALYDKVDAAVSAAGRGTGIGLVDDFMAPSKADLDKAKKAYDEAELIVLENKATLAELGKQLVDVHKKTADDIVKTTEEAHKKQEEAQEKVVESTKKHNEELKKVWEENIEAKQAFEKLAARASEEEAKRMQKWMNVTTEAYERQQKQIENGTFQASIGGPLKSPYANPTGAGAAANEEINVNLKRQVTLTQAAAKGWDQLTAAEKKNVQATEVAIETSKAVQAAAAAAIVATADLVADSITKMFQGTFTMQGFMQGLLLMVANFAKQLGEAFISIAATKLVVDATLAVPGGAAIALAAGVGLVVASNLMTANAQKMAGFAVGSNYVPYDMTAQIHRGEMIVPAAANPYANPFSVGAAGGGGKTQVYGRVSGSDIELSSTKYKRWQNRVV